ncbi:MAG: hypothetical protein ABIP41_04805 [Croceibacterium sp.]
MKTSCFIAALALLSATGAIAQNEPEKAEKKICKTERVTGSLTRVNKICMTKAEWNELAAASRKDISDRVRHGGVASGASQDSSGGPG